MFIRIKKINNKNYAYLVKNTWTPKGPRQKVTSYLGKAIMLEKPIQEFQSEPELEKAFGQFIKQDITEYMKNSRVAEIITDLLKFELLRRGFIIKDTACINGQIRIDFSDISVKASKSTAVLALNDGFLCDHTLKALINYALIQGKTEDELAFHFANTFVEAGIRIPKRIFIALFEKLMQNNT